MKDLCGVCKKFRDVAWLEQGTDRPYCQDCLNQLPLSGDELAFILLTAPWSPYGPPFKAGDVVECRTAGQIYDGVGTVQEIDTVFAHGGTPVYPTWRVALSTKAHDKAPDEAWYTENCLTRANQNEEATSD